jgi:hypothetical protein
MVVEYSGKPRKVYAVEDYVQGEAAPSPHAPGQDTEERADRCLCAVGDPENGSLR